MPLSLEPRSDIKLAPTEVGTRHYCREGHRYGPVPLITSYIPIGQQGAWK